VVPPAPFDNSLPVYALPQAAVRRERVWLHLLLFFVTLLTTTLVGAGLAQAFQSNRPLDIERDFAVVFSAWKHPAILLDGLPFSLTLMIILLAHELGHYLTCVHYGIDASLPYFLPAPTLIGTFGAFIRIRSPIYTRRALFDVGVSGPIAGFVLLVPALVIGLACSRIHPGIANHGDLVFGSPLLLRAFAGAIFPGVPVGDINLHPVARAAWVGMLATALNLLPIGQLDGGHILYAFFRSKHKLLSRVAVIALVPIGIFNTYWPWVMWAVVLALFGLRHPAIFDSGPLGTTRTRLGIFALLMFILCFTFAPIRTGG
jgi:membrane-associated protease RseP (regulator of RpoE activity)